MQMHGIRLSLDEKPTGLREIEGPWAISIRRAVCLELVLRHPARGGHCRLLFLPLLDDQRFGRQEQARD